MLSLKDGTRGAYSTSCDGRDWYCYILPGLDLSDFWKPMPSWNIITGNMLALLPLLRRFPSNAHQNYLITELSKSFNKWDSAFYLDLYVPLDFSSRWIPESKH